MPGSVTPAGRGRRFLRFAVALVPALLVPALLVAGCRLPGSTDRDPVLPDLRKASPSPVFHTPPPAPTQPPATRPIPWVSATAVMARLHQADATWTCSPPGTALSGGGTGYHCAVAADDQDYTGTLVLDMQVSGAGDVVAVYGAGMGAVPYPDGGQRDATDFLRSVLELVSPPDTNLANSVPLDTSPPEAATPSGGTARLSCRSSQTVAGQLSLTAGTCSGDWDLWETMRITMA